MSLENFFKTLKTVKGTHPLPKPYQPIPLSIAQILILSSPPSFPLSSLTPTLLHQILSNPLVKHTHSLRFFNFLLNNQSLLSFTPNLNAHLTLTSRLFQGRKFSYAESVLKNVLFKGNERYPFPLLASTIEKCCCFEPIILAKLFNLMFKCFSEYGEYDLALTTFDHMRNRDIIIDERTCTMHLLALTRNDKMMAGIEFFDRMIESGMEISVYSLTVVVDALCKSGEIKRCRELVEEMLLKGTKPNIITYNTMINACAKRWSFSELKHVLALMGKEGEIYNLNTYKILIDGYTSFGEFEQAEKLIAEMHDQALTVNAQLYNVILLGYCKQGLIDKAVLLFHKMTCKCVVPNLDTYSALIEGLCNVGKMEVAMVFLSKMQKYGIKLDETLYGILIDGFLKRGMEYEASELKNLKKDKNFDGYYSCGEIIQGEIRIGDG